MATAISIVNSALRSLGARAITSFTEQINEARIANELYNDAVIDVLRDYPWNSEAARVRLLEEVEQTISDVHYAGSGLNDLTASGTIDDGTELVFRIVIDSVGATDTFKWKASDDLDYTENVAITAGVPQLLSEGLEITFAADTGHTLNDEWHVDTKLPEWRFDHRYRLPNDFLLGKDIGEILRLFRIENGFLLTNLGEPVNVEYTRLRGDPSIVGLFPPTEDVPYEESLITALIARLKAEFAYPITKNDGLVQTCWSLYQQKLKEARAASRREGTIEVVQDTQYEDLRRGAGVIEDALDVGRIINTRFGF